MQSKLSYKQDDIKLINDFTEGMFNKNIKKAKIYIKTPQQAPQGAKIGRGKYGGLYYETEERRHFTEEVSGIEQHIKETMRFSDAEENSAQELINKYIPIAKNEFKRILSLAVGSASYRVKNKYSLLEKMQRKNYKSFDEVKDILGMRIEVNNVDEVYNTVKKLERIYGNKIIKREDVISNPRGIYRSYHLDIQYAPGIYGELQIRTPLMDKVANASHVLLYKNHINVDEVVKTNIEETLKVYSEISVNHANISDLKMLPKTKEMLRTFGL